MIGIGTIGRAAESGGGGSTTTYQNGQYIALDIYNYQANPVIHTLYYSDNFGSTFKTRTLPLPNDSIAYVHINYLGEIMIVYRTSLYYAASFTSDWVLIENQHTSSKCEVSWDFNTIIYAGDASGGSYSSMPLYISRNKGISFTSFYLTGTPTIPYDIRQIKISGDGSKAYIHYREYSYDLSNIKVCLVDLTTGSVISYSSYSSPSIGRTNYYGDYCSMYANTQSTSYQTGILYNNNLKFLTSDFGYTFFGENGWGVEYFQAPGDYKFRFFSTPSPYNTIKIVYNTISINTSGVVGDYFYYSKKIDGVIYLYKLDRNVGSNPILIKSITGPAGPVGATAASVMGVSKAPST